MKKLILALLFCSVSAFAVEDILITSNTAAPATNLRIIGTGPGDFLAGWIIGTGGSTGSRLTIYDSSNTATRTLFVIDTSSSAGVANMFNVHISSGITYTKTGNADVTLFWINSNRSLAQN